MKLWMTVVLFGLTACTHISADKQLTIYAASVTEGNGMQMHNSFGYPAGSKVPDAIRAGLTREQCERKELLDEIQYRCPGTLSWMR